MILSAWSMGIGSCCLGRPVAFLKSEKGAPFLETEFLRKDTHCFMLSGLVIRPRLLKPNLATRLRWFCGLTGCVGACA